MDKVREFFISYFLILGYYLCFDGIMIYFYNGKAFGDMIKKIQCGKKMEVRMIPTILSFFVLAFGLYYFILDKIRDDHIVVDSLRWGFVWGITVYAVYDLTNLATIKDYTYRVGIIDILWGGTLSFIVTLLTKTTMLKIKKNH